MGKGQESETSFVGAFELDLSRGTLSLDGRAVDIRPKTFALISHLARNRGRVLTRDELLDVIWPNVMVGEDSLTQAVSDLRRILGTDGIEAVKTIPGRGYMLVAQTVRPLPDVSDTPAIALLPFRWSGASGADRILADGLVEEITHRLARFNLLPVLAAHSAFAIDPADRAGLERLGIGYLVQGTVRAANARLTVGATLSEISGEVIWGDQFETSLDDMLDLASAVPVRVMSQLVAKLEAEAFRDYPGPARGFRLLIQAIALFRSHGPRVNHEARDLLLQAVEQEPNFALAHAYFGLSEVMIAGDALAPPEVLAGAARRLVEAIRLAPNEARCYRILGLIRLFSRAFDSAEAAFRRSLALNAYDADTMMQFGYLLILRGRADEGLGWMDRARALNPLFPDWYHSDYAGAAYVRGLYERAATEMSMLPVLTANREARLAAALAMAGREAEAARHIRRASALLGPGRSLTEEAQRTLPFEHESDRAHFLEGVARAIAAAGPELTTAHP